MVETRRLSFSLRGATAAGTDKDVGAVVLGGPVESISIGLSAVMRLVTVAGMVDVVVLVRLEEAGFASVTMGENETEPARGVELDVLP